MADLVTRRAVVLAATAATVTIAAPRRASAQADDYPKQPIRMVVPFAPGGPTDVLARAIGTRMTERMGQPVLVDNRAGAGGNIGAEAVAHAAPDGYTLLLGTLGILSVNPSLSRVRFDPLKDFAPVGLAANLTSIMVVHPGVGVKTARELIALAKSKPGQLSYGSSGNGSASHLAMERFKRAAGVNIQHIPYKGAAPAVNDLLAGVTQVMLIGLPTVMPHVHSGRVLALGVSSLEPSALAPGVPTLAQAAGLPGFEVTNWLGLVAPAGTPGPIVHRLNAEVVAILRDATVRDQLLKGGFEPVVSTPEQFGQTITSDLQVWRKVVTEAGIKVD